MQNFDDEIAPKQMTDGLGSINKVPRLGKVAEEPPRFEPSPPDNPPNPPGPLVAAPPLYQHAKEKREQQARVTHHEQTAREARWTRLMP
jgi:hypothetical protein